MATTSTNGRASAPSKGVGVSGVVSFGGVLYNQDYDRAWTGTERDKTIQSMLNDPLIGAVLQGIEMLVRRVDWMVTPADDSPAAQDAADFVQDCLDDMDGYWPGDTLAKVLTFLGWGWSCLEVVYVLRDDGKVGWGKWALRPQPTRYGWEFAGDDATALIQQDPQTFQRITIPLAKCLLFRYASRDNSPEGSTPLRIAFDAWYNKRKLQRIEAIGIERDLAGLPVGRVPAKDINDTSLAYTTMQNIVTNIRNDAQAGLVLPSDRDANGNYYQDVALMGTGGTRAIDTDPVIKRYANEVVTVFLANVMRAGQDSVGSYALADVQGGLFQQSIGAHLDTIAQTITEQGITPLCKLNGIPDELIPTLDHGDIESADLQRLGTYLTALGQAGLLADTPELRAFVHEVAGLPVPTPEELAKQEAEQKAAAEKSRQDALKRAQAQQSQPQDGQAPQGGENASAGATANQGGTAAAMTDPVRLVEDDGTLTLTDLMEVVAFWNETVPEQYRGMLNAKLVAK